MLIINLLNLASLAVLTQEWVQDKTVTKVRIESFLRVRMNPPSALWLKLR